MRARVLRMRVLTACNFPYKPFPCKQCPDKQFPYSVHRLLYVSIAYNIPISYFPIGNFLISPNCSRTRAEKVLNGEV